MQTTIIPADQKVYNSKWFQEQFSSNLTNDPDLYLTRSLNFNFNSLAKYNNGYYDVLFKGLGVSYTYIGDIITITINPGIFIMDSVYFEIDTPTVLDINVNNLISEYNQISLIVVVKYKYKHTHNYNPCEMKLYLYDSLRGTVYPNNWDHTSHYMFLKLYNIDKITKQLIPYSRLPIPQCYTPVPVNPNNPIPPIVNINYTHIHSFTHNHTYTVPHNHTNILAPVTTIGGITIPINTTTPNDPNNPLNLPLCSLFINYNNYPNNIILIGNTQYVYNFDYWFYSKYAQYIIHMIHDVLLRQHTRRIPTPSKMDYMYNHLFEYFGRI